MAKKKIKTDDDLTIRELFGKDVNHHVWANLGDPSTSDMCPIGDILPCLRAEIRRINWLIHLYDLAQEVGILVPLSDVRDAYAKLYRDPTETLSLRLQAIRQWTVDSLSKGYKIRPKHVKEEYRESTGHWFEVSAKQLVLAKKEIKSTAKLFAAQELTSGLK